MIILTWHDSDTFDQACMEGVEIFEGVDRHQSEVMLTKWIEENIKSKPYLEFSAYHISSEIEFKRVEIVTRYDIL